METILMRNKCVICLILICAICGVFMFLNYLLENDMKRLTQVERDEIFILHQEKLRSEEIAKQYEVTSSTINRVIGEKNRNYGNLIRQRTSNKPKHNLIGKSYGELEVIELIAPEKRHSWLYRCKCHKCGNTDFVRTAKALLERKNTTCGCVDWERKKGKENPFYKGVGEISGGFWGVVKKNARLRNIDIDITLDYAWDLYLKQNKKCALSGVDIDFGKSNYDETTASLDRIDSNIGYCEGNIQWVHKSVNFMKHDLNEGNFLYFCKKIVEWNS